MEAALLRSLEFTVAVRVQARLLAVIDEAESSDPHHVQGCGHYPTSGVFDIFFISAS